MKPSAGLSRGFSENARADARAEEVLAWWSSSEGAARASAAKFHETPWKKATSHEALGRFAIFLPANPAFSLALNWSATDFFAVPLAEGTELATPDALCWP